MALPGATSRPMRTSRRLRPSARAGISPSRRLLPPCPALAMTRQPPAALCPPPGELPGGPVWRSTEPTAKASPQPKSLLPSHLQPARRRVFPLHTHSIPLQSPHRLVQQGHHSDGIGDFAPLEHGPNFVPRRSLRV